MGSNPTLSAISYCFFWIILVRAGAAPTVPLEISRCVRAGLRSGFRPTERGETGRLQGRELMRVFITLTLVVVAAGLLVWGVQLGYSDNNICSAGPCLSPVRLGLGAGAAFGAWAAWHHLPASGALNVTPGARSAAIRLGAVVVGTVVAFAGTVLGIVQGEMVMGQPRPNVWFVSGGIVLGFLVGRALWRRANTAKEQ